MLDYVIAGAVGMIGVGVMARVSASRDRDRTSTETTGAHRRPRGCPPDPVLRLALETAGAYGYQLDQTHEGDHVPSPYSAPTNRRTV